MKVNSIKDQRNQSRELAKKQERLVKSREREIEHIKDIYSDKKTTLEIDHAKNLDLIQDRNGKEIQASIQDKESRLGHIKDELKQTQDFLKREEQILKSSHLDKMNKINVDQTDQILDLSDRSQEIVNQQQDYFDRTIQEQKLISQQGIAKNRHNALMRVTKASHDSEIKVRNLENQQKKLVSNLEEQQNIQEVILKKEFEKDLITQRESQENQVKQRDQIHKDQMVVSKEHSDTVINDERTQFQVKYKRLVDEHEGVLSRLKEKFSNQINQLKLAHHEKLTSREVKANDRFYSGGDISPVIKEDPSSYMVSMKVPEHEKDMYNISGHKREIKLSFARKYFDDTRSDETTLSTRRTESLTKTFNVSEIIDANDIKKSYQNGILTFKLAKA